MRFVLIMLSLLYNATSIAAPLVLEPVKVSDTVYAVIGDFGNQNYENDGLNANLGFVIGDDTVLVINTGPSRRVAEALHAAIRRVTNKPVMWVVNVNSQSPYWHGNAYFSELHAMLVTHAEAAKLMKAQGPDQLATIQNTLNEKAAGTTQSIPANTFTDSKIIQLGKTRVELHHYGNAHTPGDLVVWLPQSGILFTGDLGFTGRMLAVLPIGSTKGWEGALERINTLNSRAVVPGHGKVGTLADVQRDTGNYLKLLRTEAKLIFEAGGSLDDAVAKTDQSRFKYLQNYDLAAARNMNIVFQEIEKELF
jgi:glyoxylase-like metal-dependent hydrolase (beta-lactamase superfamily II)